MLGEVLTILLLTVLFTVSTLTALLVRRLLRGGLGQVMYLIWLAVMLAAVIPMQIAPPVLHVIVSERTVTEVQPPYRDQHPEIMLIKEASYPLREGDLPVLRAQLTEQEEALVSRSGDAVAFNVSGMMVAGIRFLLFVWAVGFSYRMIRELIEYREIKRYLYENSDPVTEEHVLTQFDMCREQIGLRRKISLRRIRDDCPTTPCVIGFLRSTVFLSAFCDDMDTFHMTNVFTHELCHVKRRDMLYKLLMVLTTSVHWFNPMTVLFRNAVTEDLEMACDATVLRYRKTTAVRDYMESILCVAERLRQERKVRRIHEPMFRAAFFMANDTTPTYLKRRYLHMKTTREKKNPKAFYSVCAGVLALICAANVAVLSSCAYVRATDDGQGAAGNSQFLCDPVEVAFANHFNAPSFSAITDEQFSDIETVDIYLLTPTDGASEVIYLSVDGGNVELLAPCIVPAEIFRNEILPEIEALDSENSGNAFHAKKFNAFYCIKDPADPTLEAREVAEMQALIPITKEMSVAMYDPYTTAREDDLIYSMLYDAGLVRTEAFSENAIRAKLETITALADAQISIYTAETIGGFEAESSVFQFRGETYKEYMSAYTATRETAQESEDADIGVSELDSQIDINGNGIIGE